MNKSGSSSSLKVAIWSIVVVVVAVALIVVVKLNAGSTSVSTVTKPASAELIAKITKISTAVFSKVAQGSATKLPTTISSGEAYTVGGKPAILYVGAEYCPYCAAERWPVTIALSRFGSFTGLGATTSSATDAYPSTASLSYHGSTYTSDILSFTGLEQTSNQPEGNSYTKLDTLTADQQAIVTKYDATPYVPANSAGSIPFIYIGGKFVNVGSSYDVSLLQGKTQDEIANAIRDPSTSISKGVIGAANIITASICTLTSNAPANVCQVSAITAIQASLGAK